MEGVAVLVCISRNDHGRGIRLTFPHPVIWGVAKKRREVIRIVGGSELFFPDMGIVEEVIAQHVEHRHHANYGPEEIRPLRHGCSDQQT